MRHRGNARVRRPVAQASWAGADAFDQGPVGRQPLERVGAHQLVERGAGGKRNRRNVLEALVELFPRYAMARPDSLQPLIELADVESGRVLHDLLRAGLLGDRFQHAILVLLLEIEGQPADGWILLALGAQFVPGHLHAQPLLGPVAGKPWNEDVVGLPVNQVHPALHGLQGMRSGLLRGGSRCRGYVAVDLLPGTRGNLYRRVAGTAGQRQQQGDDQDSQIRHLRPPQQQHAPTDSRQPRLRMDLLPATRGEPLPMTLAQRQRNVQHVRL
ncbi:hypothetical protein D3C85_1064030 [compost metagenome]